jgi:polyisoprenoid-binding protein YceI
MTATAPQVQTRSYEGLEIPQAGTYVIDASHSTVGFSVRHMVVSKTKGRFTDFAGEIHFTDEPLDSYVNVTIQTASIDTADAKRDEHLRSADFFDADTNKTITFNSTKVTHKGGNEFAVVGDLTIKGITKSVTLDLEYEGDTADPWGGERAGFTAKTKVNREDFGLTWNVALETGGVVVGKEITIELEVEAVRQ